jgi:Tfp pilus assembly protein PilX
MTMNNSIQTTKTSAFRNFFKALRQDRRGAELVEVLIVLAIVALGGMTAMKTIKSSTETGAKNVGDQIGKIK